MENTTTNGSRPNREMRRGYRRQAKQLRLTFDGTELDGLEVLAHSVPVGTIFDIVELAAKADEMDAEGVRYMGELFGVFADALVEWNMEEEDGTPIPATLEGIRSLDIGEALALIKAWMQAAAGVSGPLDPGSTDGKPSEVLSLPMEPSSTSHPSSHVPN